MQGLTFSLNKNWKKKSIRLSFIFKTSPKQLAVTSRAGWLSPAELRVPGGEEGALVTLQPWKRRGRASFAPGMRPSSPGGRWRGGGGPEGRPPPSALPEGPTGDSRATFGQRRSGFRQRPPGLHELPRPPTLGSPLLCQPRLLGRRLAGSSICLLPQLLPPSCRDLLGWERRVPGSDPDAGSAPACSTWGQSQRGPIPGSGAPPGPGGTMAGAAPEARGVGALSSRSLTLTLRNGDPFS